MILKYDLNFNVAFIYARDSQHGIGKANSLPWNVPNDLKFFKNTTKGHVVLMGRKTAESINYRPLKNRSNYILSKSLTGKTYQGFNLIHDPAEIFNIGKNQKVFVIGGSELFNIYQHYADVVYETEIIGDYQCDRFYKLDSNNYQLLHTIQYSDHIIRVFQKKFHA